MKALRALLGAVAVMAGMVLVYLLTLSSPRTVVLGENNFIFDSEEDSNTLSPHSHSSPSPDTQSQKTPTTPSPESPSTQSPSTSSPSTSSPSIQSPSTSSPSLQSPSTSSPSTSSLSTSSPSSNAITTGAPVLLATQAVPLYDTEMIGKVNYDIWRQPVGYLVDDLRIKRDFPSQPEVRKTIDRLRTTFDAVDKDSIKNKYGHKIYGYLLPRTAGAYVLRLVLAEVTAACSAELWLSSGSSPLSTSLIASTVSPMLGRKRSPVEKIAESSRIQLDQGQYYFELLEKAYDGKCKASIQWKEPGAKKFSDILADRLAMAVKLSGSDYADDWPVAKQLLGKLPSNRLQSHHRVEYIGDTVYPISDLDVLPSCQFTSKLYYPRELKQYAGVYLVRESYVFPADDTTFTNWYKKDTGNRAMAASMSDKVLRLYKKAFTEKGYQGEVKLHMMEESVNKNDGSRYLLELDIQLEGEKEGEVTHTSEYVYLPAGKDTLCHTANFQWRRNVDVHIVVSVKNLGVWVKHLIHNFEHVYEVTKDEHFQLIIVDYQSADLDVEAELKASSLPRWKVIKMSGGFSRSGGLQAGINYVTDPDSIIMTVDMHLTLPPGFVEYTRRHVVQGKMGFSPMFFRLNHGFTEININGFWEKLTYGLLGMYKTDWTATGGFDTSKYTTKWGGEDWDAVDKVESKGLELFRIRYPGLVHYFHTRTGMWGKNKSRR